MECDLRNSMACSSQPWGWLENKESEDDKVSRRVWEVVETKVGKVRIAKTKGRRKERRGRKEARREETEIEGRKKEGKTKKGKDGGCKEDSKRVEIWDEEEDIAKSEEKVKRLVLEYFYKWIYIFGKKTSKKISTRKLWNHAINTKKKFVSRKGKVYLLSREEREDVCKFILKQLRKEYIRPSKLPQIAPVFFVGKKNEKKYIV